MSGVGSPEPPSRRRLDGAGPRARAAALPPLERDRRRRLDGAGPRAEAAALPPLERDQSGAPALPARERV